MDRLLLFDSDCSQCSEIARKISVIAEGRISIRSLREHAIVTLLSEANNYRFEPTLLYLTADGTVLATHRGWQMRLELIRTLGLLDATRIWHIVKQESADRTHAAPSSRRAFMRDGAFALAGGVFMNRSKRSLGRQMSTDQAERLITIEKMSPLVLQSDLHQRLQSHISIAQYNLQASERFGQLNWQGAQLVEYDKVDAGAVIIPVTGKSDSLNHTGLIVYLNKTQVVVGTSIMELLIDPTISPPAKSDPHKMKKFFGAFNLYLANGEALLTSQIENGLATTVNRHPIIDADSYWDCVGECVGCAFNCYLPWWMQIVCEGACGTCIFAPNPVTCVSCLACLGGIGVACSSTCVNWQYYSCAC